MAAMRKGHDGEKKGKKWKIMTFILVTNVVASQLPERRPTGTPTARAKSLVLGFRYIPANNSVVLFISLDMFFEKDLKDLNIQKVKIINFSHFP